MAAELEKTLGLKARLIPGGKGIFDVRADCDLVFSKHASGRFPHDAEVSTLLRNRRSDR